MAHVARAEVCNSRVCKPVDLLVRGTRVEFVTTEQVRRVGRHKLDYYAMPSDIVVPAQFVLVHDVSGEVLRRCDLYLVKLLRSGDTVAPRSRTRNLVEAQGYFGDDVKLRSRDVDIPEGPWHRVAKVAFIRYHRQGHAAGFYEHEYTPAVDLYKSARVRGLRLALPEGCRVDNRGFVWP